LYLQKVLELRLASRALLRCVVVAAGVNILANLILIPPWGIQGAALATVLGYATYLLQIAARAKREMDLFPSRGFSLNLLLATLAFFGVGILAERVLPAVGIGLRFLLFGAGCPLVYLSILAVTGELGRLLTAVKEATSCESS
jgi:O-antigen/teichoic acid export membrane protein